MRLHRSQTVLVVTALAGCLGGRAWSQVPATKVVVAQARLIEARSTITLVGTVEPLRRSKVSSEIAGLVVEMPTREGDLISDGGTICRLNDDTLALLLTAAVLTVVFVLKSRRATLRQIQAGLAEISAQIAALSDEG